MNPEGNLSEPDSVEIEVRPGTPADHPFVGASWLKCLWKNSPFAKGVAHDTFFAHHKPLVERALVRASVLVAHPHGDPDTIVGYLVHEAAADGRACVQWVYVRAPWRRVGIARRLLQAARLDLSKAFYTLASYDAAPLLRKYPGLEANPYLHLLG